MSDFTDAAALRYARLALDVENANTGHEQGYVTVKPRTVPEEARRLVDGWFATRFGWPLTPRESAARDEFLSRVMHHIKESRS